MTPKEYQKWAMQYALPSSMNIPYMTLGLCNEAGEVAGKIKKSMRGDRKWSETSEALRDELGDVAWYLAGLASLCDLDLEDILRRNIDKLASRAERGKIQGDGDRR